MVRFGILGTAKIAQAFLGHRFENAEILAVASRDPSKARAFAAKHGISRFYGSYERVLADPDIDAVYIPLPQHLHCEYVIKAAEARKHVLVEKPAALSVSEIERMMVSCENNGVLFMEAFMYRFKRLHHRVKEIIESGLIGKLHYIDFNWCFNIHKLARSDFRLKRETGGGALYDLGVYGVDFFRFVAGREPRLNEAYVRRDSPDGVDTFSHVICTIGDICAAMTCGFTSDANYYVVSGELGSIYVPGSLSGRYVENLLQVHLHEGDNRYEECFAPENPYVNELEYFARCVESGQVPTPGFGDSLGNLKFIEAIFRHAEMA